MLCNIVSQVSSSWSLKVGSILRFQGGVLPNVRVKSHQQCPQEAEWHQTTIDLKTVKGACNFHLASCIWGFPDIGIPPDHLFHIISYGFSIINYKPSSYGGAPHDYGNPHMLNDGSLPGLCASLHSRGLGTWLVFCAPEPQGLRDLDRRSITGLSWGAIYRKPCFFHVFSKLDEGFSCRF